jgi:hypothetical protein
VFTELSLGFGKHTHKTNSDTEMVKECMCEVADNLFEDEQKDEIREKNSLSDSTATRRTEILAEDLTSQLDEAIQNAPGISLAVDESTDKSDNA